MKNLRRQSIGGTPEPASGYLIPGSTGRSAAAQERILAIRHKRVDRLKRKKLSR